VIFLGSDSGGNGRANYQATNDNLLTTGVWHHVALSFDLAVAGARHMMIDGVEDVDYFTHGDAALDVAAGDGCSIGAPVGGAENWRYQGDIADVFIASQYIDLSVAANLQKFRSAAGKPVNLGGDGSEPLGVVPEICLKGPASAWGTNIGSGVDFTRHGTFTDASSPS
jgi:hypothetical protein